MIKVSVFSITLSMIAVVIFTIGLISSSSVNEHKVFFILFFFIVLACYLFIIGNLIGQNGKLRNVTSAYEQKSVADENSIKRLEENNKAYGNLIKDLEEKSAVGDQLIKNNNKLIDNYKQKDEANSKIIESNNNTIALYKGTIDKYEQFIARRNKIIDNHDKEIDLIKETYKYLLSIVPLNKLPHDGQEYKVSNGNLHNVQDEYYFIFSVDGQSDNYRASVDKDSGQFFMARIEDGRLYIKNAELFS